MTLKDVIAQLLERGNAMQTFWGFYITISLGMIAFFGQAKPSPIVAALLSLGFIGFAWVNCAGMMDVAAQRHTLYRLLQALNSNADATDATAKFTNEFLGVSQPPGLGSTRAFHIASDIGVLCAVWLLALWPR